MKGFGALMVSSVFGFIVVGALLFGPAGTLDYWQAWVFLGYIALFVAVAVVSALDHRFGWSTVPTAVVVLGQVLRSGGWSR